MSHESQENRKKMEQEKNDNEGFIPIHGGYRNLITYQKSEVIYDGTIYFTNRFFKKYDRTIDQMVQAARSGELNKTPNANYQTYIKAIENPEPEVCANSMRCLIKIVSWLLSQQLKSLEKAFINEGGLRERMTKARIAKRNKKP